MLKAAAVAGGGTTLLPTFVCGPELRSGALARVLPDHEARPISLHAHWPASRLQPARLRSFVDFLVERFHTEDPAWDRESEAIGMAPTYQAQPKRIVGSQRAMRSILAMSGAAGEAETHLAALLPCDICRSRAADAHAELA